MTFEFDLPKEPLLRKQRILWAKKNATGLWYTFERQPPEPLWNWDCDFSAEFKTPYERHLAKTDHERRKALYAAMNPQEVTHLLALSDPDDTVLYKLTWGGK